MDQQEIKTYFDDDLATDVKKYIVPGYRLKYYLRAHTEKLVAISNHSNRTYNEIYFLLTGKEPDVDITEEYMLINKLVLEQLNCLETVQYDYDVKGYD